MMIRFKNLSKTGDQTLNMFDPNPVDPMPKWEVELEFDKNRIHNVRDSKLAAWKDKTARMEVVRVVRTMFIQRQDAYTSFALESSVVPSYKLASLDIIEERLKVLSAYRGLYESLRYVKQHLLHHLATIYPHEKSRQYPSYAKKMKALNSYINKTLKEFDTNKALARKKAAERVEITKR